MESFLMKSRLRATLQTFQHRELLASRYQEGQTKHFRDFSKIGNLIQRSQDVCRQMPLKTRISLQVKERNCVS